MDKGPTKRSEQANNQYFGKFAKEGYNSTMKHTNNGIYRMDYRDVITLNGSVTAIYIA